MTKEALRDTLEQLRTDVEALKFRDPQARERVNRLISAIERQLDSADDNALHDDLFEGLASSIKQFEVEHPDLTVTLNRIMTALSSMGI